MTPDADLLLGNRYRLVDRIAGGGMGVVWRARDEVLGREVAVKVLRREYAEDPSFLARFRAEARHSANLTHPGIAAVYDFGEGSPAAPGSPFLVMENVPGEPLSALIGREGPLRPELTLDIVGQAAHALQAAHDAGVIHRDVKPANILVTPTGVVKITDFGIARAANSVPLTQTGAVMGTAHYISPEQAGGGVVTAASDVYSLGVVAYECLTGQRPFAGDTPVSVALAQIRDEPPALPTTVPGPVRTLVMRMLAKTPGQRPASAGALGEEALALRTGMAAPGGLGAAGAPAAPTRALPIVAAAGDHPTRAGATTTAVIDAPARHGGDTDPGFHLPFPARLPSWLPYVVALVVFGVLLLTLRAWGDDPDAVGAAGSERDSTPAASAPAEVDVVAADYLSRPAGEVRSELEGLDLVVVAAPSEADGEVDSVTGVFPTGPVAAGSLITIEVVQPQPDEDDEKPGKGNDHDNRKKDD